MVSIKNPTPEDELIIAHVKKELEIPGTGTMFYCNDAPYDVALIALLKETDNLASTRDVAAGRISGKYHTAFSHIEGSSIVNGSFVREGVIAVPEREQKIFLRNSIISLNPSEAVDFHRQHKSYLPSNFNLDEYLEQIGTDNYFILTKENDKVSVDEFSSNAATIWLFQDVAQEYGKFIKDFGGRSINLWGGSEQYRIISCGKTEPASTNQLFFEMLNTANITNSFQDLAGSQFMEGKTLWKDYRVLRAIKYDSAK